MHHVGLDLTFLNPEAGSSTRGQSQGSEWRCDFLAELFSLDLDLERYLGTGEPDEFAKHLVRGVTEGSADSPLPPDSQGEDSQPAQGSILFSEAKQEIPQSSAQTPVLLPTEEAVRVERQPADSEGGEGRTSEAGVGVVSGRSGVVPAGRQISTSLSGFNRAVVGWGQGGGTARHLGSNPAEVFFNGPASEREGLGGVVPGRVSENQGSGRDQIVNSQGRPEIADSGSAQGVAEPRQIEGAENPSDLVNRLNSSAAAEQTQILQDRLWLPNGAAALDEGAATQWLDRTGQGGKTLTESPSVPASRTVSEVVGNRESPDATRQLPEAATTGRPSGSASEPSSAAESRKEGQETTTRPPDSAARERPDTSASRSSSTARVDGEHQDGARRPGESGASGPDVARGSGSAEQTYSLDRSGFKVGDVWRSPSRLALPPNLGPALQGFPGREGYPNTRGMFDGHSDPGGGRDRAPQETRLAAGEHLKGPSRPDIQPKGDFVEPKGSVEPSSARPHTHSPSLPTDRQGNFVQPKDVFNSPSARISTDGTWLSPNRQGSAAQPEPSANNSIARPPGDGAWLSAARPGLGSGVAATASEIVVQNPERVAKLPFQFEAQSPPKQKVEGVEQGDGEERMPEAGFKRGPGSGLESKSALEHEATLRSRLQSFSEAAPEEENFLKRSVRAQLSSSPKQTPVTDVVGRQRGNESGGDPERAAGTGGRSRGFTQASSAPPRTVEPSVLQEGPVRPVAARPLASSNLPRDESIRGGEGVAPRPEEHPEPEPDTRQPKKAFADSDQQDSHRPRTTEDKAVDPREYSSERVWKAGESRGLFQAGTADRAVDLSLPSKGASLEAGNSSQGQDGSNSSSRSAGGSELSRQSIPVWLQSPSAFVDSVAHRFVQHSRFLRNGETVRFDIELKPEFLGKIRIKTSLNHKNELAVEIKVDDPDVREALEQRLPALVEKLQAMGVEPDRLKVDGFSSHSQSDAQQQEGQRRGQPGAAKTWSQRGADEGEEESSEWPEDLEGEGIHYFA